MAVEGSVGGWPNSYNIGYYAHSGEVLDNQISQNRYVAGPSIKPGNTVAIIVDLINDKVRW